MNAIEADLMISNCPKDKLTELPIDCDRLHFRVNVPEPDSRVLDFVFDQLLLSPSEFKGIYTAS